MCFICLLFKCCDLWLDSEGAPLPPRFCLSPPGAQRLFSSRAPPCPSLLSCVGGAQDCPEVLSASPFFVRRCPSRKRQSPIFRGTAEWPSLHFHGCAITSSTSKRLPRPQRDLCGQGALAAHPPLAQPREHPLASRVCGLP